MHLAEENYHNFKKHPDTEIVCVEISDDVVYLRRNGFKTIRQDDIKD